ncbi:WG repeat-containing protein [Mongoliitalea daihaiensis]|uniref:WG repeat-containing protein n=1 Tax=Mongoliitalea daihaiensis TaxID=2782006 RepID=UPI001F3E1AE1|nr:WG repeat-containing protein [Mongoliitalea daihaiensis]UJP63289.1 WG repeat-containing protein [Mongoliitalea daihaiensis]
MVLKKASLVLVVSIFSLASYAQTYEVFDKDLKLKFRVEYDQINILGEAVRISTVNNELKLLSKEYKPYFDLKANQVIAYDQPWIVVKGKDGMGAFHEYGIEVFPTTYDDIQTYFTRVLAKKGDRYFVYDHATKQTKPIGAFDEAFMALNGQVVAKNSQGYFLPLSGNPDRIFEKITQVNENFLFVQQPTGYGLVNREGDYVLEPVIDRLDHLEGDYFFGFDGNQYMLIKGREGKADIRYTSYHKITVENDVILEYIHGKLRRVMNYDGILLDQVGMEAVSSVGEKHYNVRLRDAKIGLLGPKGWEVNPMSQVDKILPGSEGLYPAYKGGKIGFVDKQGRWVIPPSYEQVGKFSQGKAAVSTRGSWAFINTQGNPLTEFKFEQSQGFVQGVAVVQYQGLFNLVDAAGHVLFDQGFDRIFPTENNYYLTERQGLMGLLSPAGKVIAEPSFQEIRREEFDRIVARQGDKYGILNENGEFLLPLYYRNIIFDQGSQQILAEDAYQFEIEDLTKSSTSNQGKKKRGS